MDFNNSDKKQKKSRNQAHTIKKQEEKNQNPKMGSHAYMCVSVCVYIYLRGIYIDLKLNLEVHLKTYKSNTACGNHNTKHTSSTLTASCECL